MPTLDSVWPCAGGCVPEEAAHADICGSHRHPNCTILDTSICDAVVTAHRSDDGARCSNNAGVPRIALSLAHMMMGADTVRAVTCRRV
ncbi:hypothetical protein EV679_2157 [Kerstersia gyiorum]|uniref:Uncharacterized protein n=1 Tax=Kerstersia gyiorum TaxID=206506 RepID=A0A4Q7MM98_9BURK|nr:hypothetical protein EV679_2157 [Kerstersia gyiorum]